MARLVDIYKTALSAPNPKPERLAEAQTALRMLEEGDCSNPDCPYRERTLKSRLSNAAKVRRHRSKK